MGFFGAAALNFGGAIATLGAFHQLVLELPADPDLPFKSLTHHPMMIAAAAAITISIEIGGWYIGFSSATMTDTDDEPHQEEKETHLPHSTKSTPAWAFRCWGLLGVSKA